MEFNREKTLEGIFKSVSFGRIDSTTSEAERFQNETLRPIAKFQHHLLMAVFQHYIKLRKNVFHQLNQENQLAYIEKSIKNDSRLRNQIQGIFIALFTEKEYQLYIESVSVYNKRIHHLCIERLQDSLQLLQD
ncbi:MAG: glyoxalase [Bacteroidota bacterium]